jgi:hypothetical protein
MCPFCTPLQTTHAHFITRLSIVVPNPLILVRVTGVPCRKGAAMQYRSADLHSFDSGEENGWRIVDQFKLTKAQSDEVQWGRLSRWSPS